ncbi:MAG TPA: hypothetical protein VM511_06465 [Luteolibacter sp.]|nr:hypothetical protein [Luteolibacter sp.]
MTIDSSPTLAALIEAYENSIVFEESAPNAFRVAKTFTRMRWSNGGIVLLGVRDDGYIVGVASEDLGDIYERFDQLCRDLTPTRIELGTLMVGDKIVVFMVFNTIPRNLAPLQSYSSSITNTRFI